MNISRWLVIPLTFFCGVIIGNAAGPLHVFSSGQTIRASEINDNFSSIKTMVDAIYSGFTCTGAITLGGAPTSPNHAVTKSYVDDNFNYLAASISAVDTFSQGALQRRDEVYHCPALISDGGVQVGQSNQAATGQNNGTLRWTGSSLQVATPAGWRTVQLAP